MLRKLLLSPLLFMSIVSLAQNTTPQWNRKADLPTPRAGCRAVALEGKLYVVGGATGFEDAVSTFEVYDPNTDRWSKLADLPSPVAFGGAAAFGGKIYVLNQDRLYVYDPAGNNWTEAAKAPRAHRNFEMATCGDKLYAVGGLEPSKQAKYGEQNLATVDAFDPMTGKWETRASMQIARHALPPCLCSREAIRARWLLHLPRRLRSCDPGCRGVRPAEEPLDHGGRIGDEHGLRARP